MTTSDSGDLTPFSRPTPRFGEHYSLSETGSPQNDPTSKQAVSRDRDTRDTNALENDAAANRSTVENEEAKGSVDPYTAYPLSVKDIRSKLFGLGISKSKDSIQRYCREGMLDCIKLGMLRRYYVTEASVDALIETLQNDVASSGGMQLHESERSGNEELLLLHGPSPAENMTADKVLHEAASSGMRADAAVHSGFQSEEKTSGTDAPIRIGPDNPASDPGMMDFLKDQLRVKDEQIKVKDEQIAAMLERDRETNILIRGLQDRIGDAFGLLVGNTRGERERATAREGSRPSMSHPSGTDVENGDGQ